MLPFSQVIEVALKQKLIRGIEMEKTLSEYIDHVVTNNSGGVKFMTLMIDLMGLLREHGDNALLMSISPDSVEDEIKNNMPHLGILEYAMDLEVGELQRIKSFVYRKLV